MTTPLFLLRCTQLGLSMADLELLSIGLINDMYSESRNDDYNYAEIATQEDYDRFLKKEKKILTKYYRLPIMKISNGQYCDNIEYWLFKL